MFRLWMAVSSEFTNSLSWMTTSWISEIRTECKISLLRAIVSAYSVLSCSAIDGLLWHLLQIFSQSTCRQILQLCSRQHNFSHFLPIAFFQSLNTREANLVSNTLFCDVYNRSHLSHRIANLLQSLI